MSDDNIVNFPGDVTFVDLDPQEMVKNAMEAFHWQTAIIIGRTGDNDFTVCSSTGDAADIVYSFELAKKQIMENAVE